MRAPSRVCDPARLSILAIHALLVVPHHLPGERV